MGPANATDLSGQQLGDYLLTALLGVGGTAQVYRAFDVGMKREVALKVLAPGGTDEVECVARFRSEARRVAALDHPNIVPVYHYGEERGLLYLVMPLLPESLRDRMKGERLTVQAAVQCVTQVAAGLGVAHAFGLVHRDIKPGNILLNAEGIAMLADFGIACEAPEGDGGAEARTVTATGLPVGTPRYMAPEQLRGALVDHRADLYALGVVLYELLTGVVPFDAPTPYEVAALALTTQALAPSAHNPVLWPEIDEVVLRALAHDPSERQQDAAEFAAQLRDAMRSHSTNTSTVASPAGITTRQLREFSEAHRRTPLLAPDSERLMASLSAAARTTQPTSRIAPQQASGSGSGARRWVIGGAVASLTILSLLGSGMPDLQGIAALPVGLIHRIATGSTSGSSAGTLPSTSGHPGGAPGAATTPSSARNATPGASETATSSTPSTDTGRSTATATPVTPQPSGPPPSATFTPAAIQLQRIGGGGGGGTCSGSQVITNDGTNPETWWWQTAMQGSFQWSVNGGQNSSNPQPTHMLAAGTSDTLQISLGCGPSSSDLTVTVGVTDNVTGSMRTYTVAIMFPAATATP